MECFHLNLGIFNSSFALFCFYSRYDAMQLQHYVAELKQRVHFSVTSYSTIPYILKIKQCFLISSNHLSNYKVKFGIYLARSSLTSKMKLLLKNPRRNVYPNKIFIVTQNLIFTYYPWKIS